MTRLGERARTTLKVLGWHKGGEPIVFGGGWPLCLVEVLALHAQGFGVPVGDALVALGFSGVGEAVAWNDAPERTFDDVLERLERL